MLNNRGWVNPESIPNILSHMLLKTIYVLVFIVLRQMFSLKIL